MLATSASALADFAASAEILGCPAPAVVAGQGVVPLSAAIAAWEQLPAMPDLTVRAGRATAILDRHPRTVLLLYFDEQDSPGHAAAWFYGPDGDMAILVESGTHGPGSRNVYLPGPKRSRRYRYDPRNGGDVVTVVPVATLRGGEWAVYDPDALRARVRVVRGGRDLLPEEQQQITALLALLLPPLE